MPDVPDSGLGDNLPAHRGVPQPNLLDGRQEGPTRRIMLMARRAIISRHRPPPLQIVAGALYKIGNRDGLDYSIGILALFNSIEKLFYSIVCLFDGHNRTARGNDPRDDSPLAPTGTVRGAATERHSGAAIGSGARVEKGVIADGDEIELSGSHDCRDGGDPRSIVSRIPTSRAGRAMNEMVMSAARDDREPTKPSGTRYARIVFQAAC